MKIPLLSGRGFNEGDRADTTPVAIISRIVADRYFTDPNPIGRQFRLAADGPAITVIGVAADILHDWFQQRRAPTVYRPLSQEAPYAHAFVVRTIGNPLSIAGDLRRAVNAVDPDQPIITLETMETLVTERSAGLNFIANALAVVALIALVMAVMGLYSLMAYIVSRRTQELGVRMALGATKWQVIGLTSGQGVRITIAGIVIDILAAFGIGRLLESVLFGVVSASPTQLTLLALFVFGVSLLASYIPARRTAALDPTLALRSE
jgi:putative ABC transport system permease protein